MLILLQIYVDFVFGILWVSYGRFFVEKFGLGVVSFGSLWCMMLEVVRFCFCWVYVFIYAFFQRGKFFTFWNGFSLLICRVTVLQEFVILEGIREFCVYCVLSTDNIGIRDSLYILLGFFKDRRRRNLGFSVIKGIIGCDGIFMREFEVVRCFKFYY